MFLLPTTLVLDLLQKKPTALRLIKKISQQARPAISTLSFTELAPQLPKASYQKTWQFLQTFKILPVTDRVAFLAGELINSYRQLDKTLSINDALLAATALLHGCTLFVTNPVSFSFIKGLELQLYDKGFMPARKQRTIKTVKPAARSSKPVIRVRSREFVTRAK